LAKDGGFGRIRAAHPGEENQEPGSVAPKTQRFALRLFFSKEVFMLKRIAVIFGVVFVLVGVLGFIPAVTPGGKLLGLFDVNTVHNLVHLATGVVGIAVGMASEQASKLFFQVFGVIYALVAIAGFFYGDKPLLGLVANNTADAGLHVIIAAVALYLGFGMKSSATAPS
jgi:hypothetical protein